LFFLTARWIPKVLNTFAAYSGAVDQRGAGASEAAKLGAVAVIVRSMGLNIEEYPHTGGVRYAPNVAMIPAVAVSTKHAELLSKLLKDEKELQVYIETHSQILEDAPSFNVSERSKAANTKMKSLLSAVTSTRGIWPKVHMMMVQDVCRRLRC
jgi:PA domain.